jgi:dipeptidyl aminopeptidase/acylaminoacyl peptidase
MRMIASAVAALIGVASVAAAEVPTPARPVTDPRSLTSPLNAASKPIPIGDLAFSRDITSGAWSADGKQLFLSTNMTGRYNIWRTNVSGSWPVQLTQSDDRQIDVVVSPDGRSVFFEQDKGGDEQFDIFSVPTSGGAVTNLTNTPGVSENYMVVSPDGRRIAFARRRKSEGQTNIAVLDLATRKVKVLTAEADPQWGWGPVAWVGAGRSLIADRCFVDQTQCEVWKIDGGTGASTRLLGKPATMFTATGATPDGDTLAVQTNEGTGQVHGGVYSIRAAHWRWLKPSAWEQNVHGISPDGRWLAVDTNIDARTELRLVNLATMRERVLPMPPGAHALGAGQPFSPDSRRLYIIRQGANAPQAPAILDLHTGVLDAPVQLAMASLDPSTLPRSQIVTYRSFDGTLVSAILTMPFNLNRDGSNPAVVLPHGGPTDQATDSFNQTATALASRGYLVIQPNPRGSTGYGHAFQVANYQDLGGGDLKDELAAKDFLVASGYVDPHRVGITGGSYGGFMTLMAIGRAPDAFAAAVQLFGIIDWRTLWTEEDPFVQAYQKSLLGDPAAFPKVYDATSPLTYIRAVKAPLLSLQGENDVRVPRAQAQQVTDALKAKGNIAEVVFYAGEGHVFQKRETNIDALTRTIAWFDKYLKAPAH